MRRWMKKLLPCVLLGVCLSAAAQMPASGPGASVLTVTPACLANTEDMKTRQFSTEPITVRYNPATKGAVLRSPGALTLHIAPFQMNRRVQEKDLAMVRQEDGTWLIQFSLQGQEASGGYLMFDVEDGEHRIDGNGGSYWDVLLCNSGKDSPVGMTSQAMTYEGYPIMPGMQRPRDLTRTVNMLRAACTEDVMHCSYTTLWVTELRLSNQSPATFQQISGEISDLIDWINATQDKPEGSQFQGLMGFVEAFVSKLDPVVMTKLRASIVSLPQTEKPMQYDREMNLHPIPRTAGWEALVQRSVRSMLSELDFEPAHAIADSAARAAAEEAVAMEYRDCKELCYTSGQAFGYALQDYAAAGDFGGAWRTEGEWETWDAKNPDPSAAMAKELLKANRDLPEALQLAVHSRELSAYFDDPTTFQVRIQHFVKSQSFFAAAPFANTRWQGDFLLGRIEAVLERWPEAAADLQRALDGKPPESMSRDVAYALGQAEEHTGDKDAALKAYFTAASSSLQSDAIAQEAYVRLYTAMRRGTAGQAEAGLLAVERERDKKAEEEYVPVELHRSLPKLQMTTLAGKAMAGRSPGRPVVMQFWATWCIPCVEELPALLTFQKAHPEVDFLAVAISESPHEVEEFLQKRKLMALHVAVMSKVPQDVNPGVPSTMVLNAQGELNFLHVGGSGELTALLNKDLNALKR